MIRFAPVICLLPDCHRTTENQDRESLFAQGNSVIPNSSILSGGTLCGDPSLDHGQQVDVDCFSGCALPTLDSRRAGQASVYRPPTAAAVGRRSRVYPGSQRGMI